MRKILESKLEQLENRGDWHYLTEQMGMFSLINLDREQIRVLMNKYHIYMLNNGRISFTGLNSKNISYVADAIRDVLQNHRSQ
uniref:Aspartate aminotransferase, mitochondrial n=1 Tax=Romanomermis culicivorax TaxID=13658 RepID=A0A915HVK9_ROMCU